eukprot:2384788-Rhodomonas_salina.1
MITINFSSSDAGLSRVIWERSNKELTARIHSLIHANTSRREYDEGESLFSTYITSSLAMAAEHDKDAAKYSQARTRQLARYLEAFVSLKQDLVTASWYFKDPDLAFRMQMEDLITTAMGVGMTNAQMRNLNAMHRLRKGFSGIGTDVDDHDDGFDGGNGGSNQLGLSHQHHRQFDHNGSGGHNKGGKNKRDRDAGQSGRGDRSVPGGKLQTNHRQDPKDPKGISWAGTVKDNAKKPSRDKRKCGDSMPTAMSIISADTNGAEEVDNVCIICGQGGSIATGHRVFECAIQFANDNPGKVMPGFTASGERDAKAWNCDSITRETK